jgi:hypothetical protein
MSLEPPAFRPHLYIYPHVGYMGSFPSAYIVALSCWMQFGSTLMLAYTRFVFFLAWFIEFHLGILGELHFVHRAITGMDGRKGGETPSSKTYFL